MSNLKRLFRIGQDVTCNLDHVLYKGTVSKVYEDHIEVDIPGFSDHCRFEEGLNLDLVYPDYTFPGASPNGRKDG